jgi:hypothetical protein
MAFTEMYITYSKLMLQFALILLLRCSSPSQSPVLSSRWVFYNMAVVATAVPPPPPALLFLMYSDNSPMLLTSCSCHNNMHCNVVVIVSQWINIFGLGQRFKTTTLTVGKAANVAITSQSGSVSVETRLRTGRPGFSFRQGQWWNFFFSLPPRPDWLWGTPSLLSNGYWALSSGVKLSERKADHPPPSSAEVKNAWSCISTPPIRVH